MKTILFICIENSCRSQMAEGLAKSIGQGLWQAYSAGSKPSGAVNPTAVLVMKEIGIDITTYSSKGFDDLPVERFDFVVTLGCGDQCPFVPAEKHIDWNVPDPKNKDLEFFRSVRDLIGQYVKQLAQDIKQRG
jgi:protein-tyrosine-phosphatase